MSVMNWDDMRIFLSVAQCRQPVRRRQDPEGDPADRGAPPQGPGGASLGARLFEQPARRVSCRRPAGMSSCCPWPRPWRSTALAVDRRQPGLAEGAKGTVRISAWESFAQLLTDHLDRAEGEPAGDRDRDLGQPHPRQPDPARGRPADPANACRRISGLIARRLVASYTFAVYGARDYVAANPAALGEARYEALPVGRLRRGSRLFP